MRRRALTIGIVNNMPEAAFDATARQFDDLLRRAIRREDALDFRFFAPPDRMGEGAAASIRHEPSNALWTATLDGLIVTGTEPQAARIADEPTLPFLARLFDWAEEARVPAVWSCLAAHAAVHRLDGIERRHRDAKLFGVFACDRAADHPLLAGLDGPWLVPHSRLNELPEDDLTACGYTVLTPLGRGRRRLLHQALTGAASLPKRSPRI